jgi:glycosyltransferase involved in cell wall biosynthesis
MSSTVGLTACVLTPDAEACVAECLVSLAFADERLVLDGGSRDCSVEVARAHGALEERPFTDFADQRNLAAALARHDWVFFVDADERVTDSLRSSVQEALSSLGPDDAAFGVRRRNFYLGRWLRHGAWEPDVVVRLYDRRRARWHGPVHERLRLDSGLKPRLIIGTLEHRSLRSLEDQVARLNRHSSIASGRGRWPGLKMLLRLPVRFLRASGLKLGFLEGRVQAMLSAFVSFLMYAKQLERSMAPEPRDPQP